MIILSHRTTALKITNKGGNHGGDWKGTKGTGTDYVTFECPGCKKRNKQSMYDVRMKISNNVLSFSCKHCSAAIEVTLPIQSSVGLIVTPDQYKKEITFKQRAPGYSTMFEEQYKRERQGIAR